VNPVAHNLTRTRESIKAIASRVGRDSQSVKLVLVTKQVDVERIRIAYDLGERDFGENRVQELLGKASALPPDIRWHFIGRLQTNKVREVVGIAHLVHSVDSLRLAEKLEEEGRKSNMKISALIQCNTSGEQTKSGLAPEEIGKFLERAGDFGNIEFKGFMTMAPLGAKEEVVRKTFSELRKILESARKKSPRFAWEHLSMGMSQDYEIAIEEGATLVRIGTAVFGERNQ